MPRRDLQKLAPKPGAPLSTDGTALTVARCLEELGFTVQRGIGGHGVVSILHNGKGQNVLLRTKLDALTIKEETGLPYASNFKQVDADGITESFMHACGRDKLMHMASLTL